jgi:hypothetical protein
LEHYDLPAHLADTTIQLREFDPKDAQASA